MSITRIWRSPRFVLSMRPSHLWIRREPGELRVLRFLNADLVHYEIYVSSLKKFSKSSSVKLRRRLHVSLIFNYWTRVSCVEPRVWASTFWHFFLFSWYWSCVLFAVRYAMSPLMKRNFFGHIDGADFNVLFSMQKTTPAFIGANKEWQARLTDNYSESQSSFSGMVLKESEEDLYNKSYKWLCQIWTSLEYYWFAPR